ncbi:glycogen/starch synthase [Dysgonomonas sp. HDW5A]|uniref:glycogen/starch synthase n=1 Tax=unclassified Dysgonomonas TaxID=2630389 RepID=UPI00140D6E35|nr:MULTISPECIES: glycogen/starch synthase [unclassified Dysgonomonas]QIK52825.1 glycogen/starch synthase [Dysgonomonas sp. HDW5B]QIK61531.1 glycogen/starch synthase [Dysgonomonas sp. HDW5A]
MSIKRVLFITQEITPYLPESLLANTCRYLPQAIQEKGKEIRTFMPKFGNINERRNQLHEVIRLSGMNLIIDDTDHPLIIKVASIQAARMQVYFIDNDDFFSRKNTIMDDDGKEFLDNDERSIFYVRGVLETIKKLRWIPDVIHCHGWMTALTPLYIKTAFADDPCFKDAKVVYSLYNDDFKQPFSDKFGSKLKLAGITDKYTKDLTTGEEINYVKLTNFAMKYADGVIQTAETVNPALLEYINNNKVKFLPYQGNVDESADAINSFYDTL